MLVNKDIANFIYANDSDTLKEYYARLSAKNLQAPHLYINHINIYNGKINRFVNTGSIVKESNISLLEKIQTSTTRKYAAMEFFPRRILLNTDERDVYNTLEALTFVIYPAFALSSEEPNVIIINVDADYIINMVDSISRNGGGELLIIDKDGIVLSSSEKENFATNISDDEIVQKVFSNENDTGSFQHKGKNGKQLITFVKSSKLDWFFIMSQDYSNIFSDIKTLRLIIILVALALFAIALFLSLYFSKKLYFPLKRLTNAIEKQLEIKHSDCIPNEYEYLREQISTFVDKSHSVEKSISNALPLFRDAWLRMALKGQPSNNLESGIIAEYIEESISSSSFYVVVGRADRYDSIINNGSYNIYEQNKIEISDLIKDFLKTDYNCQVIFTAPDEISLILLLKNEILPIDLSEKLLALQKIMFEEKQLSMSFAVGDIAYSADQLQSSYQSASEYIRYRIFKGPRCIIKKSDIEFQMNNIIDYPVALENELIETISPNSREDIPAIVGKFINLCAQSTYQTFILYCNQLMLSVLRHFNSVLESEDTSNIYTKIMQKNLSYYSSTDDIQSHIIRYCNEICSYIECQFTSNRFELVKEMKEKVEHRFCEELFSINSIAKEMCYSPDYLNRLFRSITNIGFSNYLNNVRLEKATNYLNTSSHTVSKIGKMVGFSNNGYFFTLFKKKYGVTPNQYRKCNNKGGMA
jgi:AraC-like DNA-binding protein